LFTELKFLGHNYSGLNQTEKVAVRLSIVDFDGFMIALRKQVANFSNSSKDLPQK
jgi:hypothetical protein